VKNLNIMAEGKFTDGDVLNELMESLDYENEVLGVNPMYTNAYMMTADEAKDKPLSPLLNW